MKKYFKLMILASLLVSPMAVADETAYGGLSFGRVDVDEIETGNLGIVLGAIADNGFGYELFYSFSVVDYDKSYNSFETDTINVYVVYRTPGKVYFKAKAGYSYVNITFVPDVGDIATGDGESDSDSTEGFSYGLAGGIGIGDGALELTYYRFPDFDDFAGVPFDEEVEMINLAYLWSF
jgi:hypothetical protein